MSLLPSLCLAQDLHPIHNQQFILEHIKHTLIRHLHHNFPHVTTNNIHITITSSTSLDSLPPSAALFKVAIPSNANVLGKNVLPIHFFNQQRHFLERRTFFAVVSAYGPVIVSAKHLLPGHIITKDSVAVRHQKLYNETTRTLTNIHTIIGKETISTLPKGQIMRKWMIKTRPIVQKGESVNVVMSTGKAVKLRLSGTSLEEGSLSQSIDIQLKSTKKIVKAIITGTNNVEISHRH